MYRRRQGEWKRVVEGSKESERLQEKGRDEGRGGWEGTREKAGSSRWRKKGLSGRERMLAGVFSEGKRGSGKRRKLEVGPVACPSSETRRSFRELVSLDETLYQEDHHWNTKEKRVSKPAQQGR